MSRFWRAGFVVAVTLVALWAGRLGERTVIAQNGTPPPTPPRTCANPPNAIATSSVRVAFNNTNATITWAPPTGGCAATGYLFSITYGANDPPPYFFVTGPSVTLFWNDDQPRWIRVRAINADMGGSGEGPATPPLRFQRGLCLGPPPEPTNVRLTDNVVGSTTVAWNSSARPDCTTRYILGAGWEPRASELFWETTQTSFSVTLVPGRRWYLHVMAVNERGASPVSQSVGVDPIDVSPLCPARPATPLNLEALVNGRTLTINWVMPPEACPSAEVWLTAEATPAGPRLDSARLPAANGTLSVTFAGPVTFWLRAYGIRDGLASFPTDAILVTVP